MTSGHMPVDDQSVTVAAGLLLLSAGVASCVSGSWLPVIAVSAGILLAKWYLDQC